MTLPLTLLSASVAQMAGAPLETASRVEWLAIGVLVAIAGVIAWLVLRRIVRHPDGWRPGLLTFGLRGYCAAMFGQHVRHASTVPAKGAALVVANHRSPVDPLLMHAAASFQAEGRSERIIEWLTAREYAKIGGPVGWICDVARSIPVDRGGNDMAAVKEAMKRLKNGHVVGIFPEGKINTGSGLLEFNPGLAFIAARSRVPVIPAYIDDAPAGSSMVEPFVTPTRSRVTFGEPLDFTHIKRPTAVQRIEITQQIRDAILALMPPEKRGSDPVPEPSEVAEPVVETPADLHVAERPETTARNTVPPDVTAAPPAVEPEIGLRLSPASA